jgi:hypothetical protein
MIAFAVLMLALGSAAPADTSRPVMPDSATGPVTSALTAAFASPEDTVPRQRKSVEVGEWYERRLRIHRYGSYAVYPLFALQAIAGNQLFPDPHSAPGWAKTGHQVGAAGLATVFTTNTITGLWNLWDSRTVEQGRARRTIHALLMLASDAGFTYAGVRLSKDAERSIEKRREHRAWAYGSMGIALTGIGVMTLWKEN